MNSLYAGAFCVGKPNFQSSCRATEELFCVGTAHLENSCRVTEESSGGEIPIYKPQVEPWRSILRGKSLFTNSICCLEERFRVGNFYLQTQLERFVWEISIYKLNRSVSCGKFLFTNSTGAFSCGKFLFTNSTSVFSLFTNYLQTYLQTSLVREKAFSRRAIRGQKSFNQTLDFYIARA